jgi:predicted acylesterase/phospholipase RssA
MNRDQEALDKKWDEVRKAELSEIATRRAKAELQGDPHANLTGLALSGGGIRSASFNLGVLQALVEKGVFRYIDFLSTVSGGGYIGSFISSLAYRQHLDEEHAKLAQAPNTPAPGYIDPPIAPKGDGSQPEATTLLARNSNFLNDTLDAVSRYLIGWFLNFVTLFSGLVLGSSVVALFWRSLDMPPAANFMLFFSGGLIQDWSRPFLPAAGFFVAWVVIWSWSYFRKGSVASARHSGKLLILSIVCLLIGLAIWLGTPNMNLSTTPVASYDQLLALWNGNQQWLWPLAIGWLVTMLPLLRPRELMKSGTDTTSLWRGWVFTIAGYGAVVGIPFATVYFIGQHNVSRVADGWRRDIVADDIIDWEKFWWQIRDDAQRGDERLTPAVLFYQKIQPASDEKKSKAQELVENDFELHRIQNDRILNEGTGQFFTDLWVKDQVANLATAALNADYLHDYIRYVYWQAQVERMANKDLVLFQEVQDDALWRPDRAKRQILISKIQDLELPKTTRNELLDFLMGRRENSGDAKHKYLVEENVGSDRGPAVIVFDKSNHIDLNSTARKDLLRFLQGRQRTLDERLASYQGLSQEQQDVQDLVSDVKTVQAKLGNLASLIRSLKNPDLRRNYRNEIDAKVAAALADPAPKDPFARKEVEHLAEIIALYRFYELESLDFEGVSKDKGHKNRQITDEWLAKKYTKSETGHALLRLFYPTYLRPIRFANRPLVIGPDQWVRLWILLSSGVVFLFFGSVINFNGTSMHGFYRRCIQRAFLVRHANTDDDREHREIQLTQMSNTEEGYPYHILSGCVEVNTGSRGEPIHLTGFQFAKLHCGGREIDFCKTDSYRKGVMTLSSAAAVSGAAVSPTRIHYLLLKVMMTITNLRLGQWLPNPGKSQDLSRPTFVPLLRIAAATLFSRDTLEQALIFVTDGGHYENLGLEVLLDRRCRLIIASDAGADPTFEFADLANVFAIARRKGVRFVPAQLSDSKASEEITLESVQNAIKESNMAIWRIKYPDAAAEGLCIYLKSSLIHPQPFEVGQYKLWNEDFPHDATSNQFFHERQFEVYRELGYQIALEMIKRLQFNDEQQAKRVIDIDRLLKKGGFSKNTN